MADIVRLTLEAARRNKKLTQKKVATIIGVSNKTLSSWENGRSFPKPEQIDALCDLYGVHYDNLIFLPTNSL
ncbi:MAG: helix-turn-helix transcriptional regulator [Clostridia bacterium]|nr:helix-turn-helix transcriptional regulator [Clostridia bacterium]